MNKIEKQTDLGICTICQTIHVNQDGFDGNRGCINCGETSVYSVTEACDIINDYKSLKRGYSELLNGLNT